VDLDEFGLSMSNSLLINRPLGRVRKTATTHSATNEAGDTEQNQPQLQEPTHFRRRILGKCQRCSCPNPGAEIPSLIEGMKNA